MRMRSRCRPGFVVGVRARPLLVAGVLFAFLWTGTSLAQTVPPGFAVVDVNRKNLLPKWAG